MPKGSSGSHQAVPFTLDMTKRRQSSTDLVGINVQELTADRLMLFARVQHLAGTRLRLLISRIHILQLLHTDQDLAKVFTLLEARLANPPS